MQDENEYTSLKQPPHSTAAEQSVLGAIMMDPAAVDNIQDIISPEDFYAPSNRLVYQAAIDLVATGSPTDFVTIAERLQTTGKLDNLGGLEYLEQLLESSPSSANIVSYAKTIKDRSLLRSMISACNTGAHAGYNSQGEKAEDILNKVQSQIMAVGESTSKDGSLVSIETYTKPFLDIVEERSQRKSSLVGVSSGFHSLDSMTFGLPQSDLIIIAGRPSHGKTQIALNIAEYVAMNSGWVGFFSAEMPAKEGIMMRMYSNLADIPHSRLRSGKLSQKEWDRLSDAVNKYNKSPLYIDETPSITTTQIRSRTRRIMKERGESPALIVVDYIQIMGDEALTRHDGETGRLNKISMALKNIAREFKCPVIALSQLNRSIDARQNKRPLMSDLKQAGGIEQDADIICFIYREEVYDPDTNKKGIGEIIVGKQRNGPLGTKWLKAEMEYCRFLDMDKQPEIEDKPDMDGFDYDG